MRDVISTDRLTIAAAALSSMFKTIPFIEET